MGFEALAEEMHKPAKNLHRMLSRSGNPTISNISAVFAAIKRALGSRCLRRWWRPELELLEALVHRQSRPSRMIACNALPAIRLSA